MNAEDLKTLGINPDNIEEAAVEQVADYVQRRIAEVGEADFHRVIKDMISERIEEVIASLFEKHVQGGIKQLIEDVTLQTTNEWGEKQGEVKTFREYLVHRAEIYLTETVNREGRSKGEDGSYGWKGMQTRISHIIHEHFHYEISTELEQAVAEANKSIADGIQETVKIKLKEITKKLKVEVKTGR